jgi:hypothetical protein
MAKFMLGPKPPAPAKKPKLQGPPPDPPIWEQLFPSSWRDVDFPVSSIKLTLEQDLTEHKYWGRDAARVEATGRESMIIEATIPFVNGIVPGKNEKWGLLYPVAFRNFLRAFADKKSGKFIHPELGEVVCKPRGLTVEHDAMTRNGVIVTATWTENQVDNDAGVAFGDSNIKNARSTVKDLEASKADLVALTPPGAFPEESFDSLINKATGFVDKVTTTVDLLINKPRQVVSRIQQFQNSVDRLRQVNLWPLQDAAERVKASLLDIEDAFSTKHTVVGTGPQALNAPPPLNNTGRSIGRFITPKGVRMTASAVQASLPAPNSMEDLIALNPTLVSRPEVGGGTLIRYYT